VHTAEEEYARLLTATKEFQTSVAAPATADAEPVTSGLVSARWKRAQELVREGDGAEALRELLWCYDVGMVQVTSMRALRLSAVLMQMAMLGERYPQVLEVLRERRDQVRQRVLASESDFSAVQEFGAINRALKDERANLAVFDQLPPGDRRRRTLASSSSDYLVENRRYKDAAEARPYASISSVFELLIQERPLPTNTPNPEEFRRKQRESVVALTARNIELLAGSGDLPNARTLAERLLAYDNSEATRALIQKHAERAGQPTLLAPAANP
jgi:hypothetical protein